MILAVDGGSTKTDVALLTRGGDVLGTARGPGIPYARVGVETALHRLVDTVAACWRDARRRSAPAEAAEVAVYCLPGVDLQDNRRAFEATLAASGLAKRTLLRNDTFAVLRAGTDRGWGVAVVCGAGINCLGIDARGRRVRFPSLGWISGDIGGGHAVGRQAVAAAIRGRDGRGPRSTLERRVPDYFGFTRPAEIASAIHSGRLDAGRLAELPPLVFAAAREGDAVAEAIVEALVEEVVATAAASIRRLRLVRSDVDVILGGGLARTDDLVDRVRDGIAAVAPRAHVTRLAGPPVAGAALLGLDVLGEAARTKRRVRLSLTEERIAGDGGRAAQVSPAASRTSPARVRTYGSQK
jgi:N-acetylglucosamine kinase-like BadF-type ATPase